MKELITRLDPSRKVDTFAAIDFETYTHDPLSACSVGVVVVKNGVVVEKFYSLINPISTEGKPLTSVHGLNIAMLSEAPAPRRVFYHIKELITDMPIAAHNASFDRSVLTNCLSHLGIDYPDPEIYDTYRITGQSLDAYCAGNDIPLGKHHDALDDAAACASVLLHVQNVPRLSDTAEEVAKFHPCRQRGKRQSDKWIAKNYGHLTTMKL